MSRHHPGSPPPTTMAAQGWPPAWFANVLVAARSRLSQPLRKAATFFWPDSSATGLDAGVGGERVGGGFAERKSAMNRIASEFERASAHYRRRRFMPLPKCSAPAQSLSAIATETTRRSTTVAAAAQQTTTMCRPWPPRPRNFRNPARKSPVRLTTRHRSRKARLLRPIAPIRWWKVASRRHKKSAR